MDRKRSGPPLDRRVAQVAGRQHGAIARRQLVSIGLGAGAIATRVRAGRLHRVHQGVYAVGHPRLSREGRLMAALLAFGPAAVLSHRSAAELWGIGRRGALVEVTVRTARRARAGVRIHRSPVPPEHRTVLRGFSVTTPARTIIDLADESPRREVERGIDEAEYLRLDCTGLAPLPGRRGAGRLARILRDHAAGTTRTRSELEERFLLLCVEHGLPRPEVNARLQGFEVDFVWRAAHLVVELDGHAAHGTRRAFERDRLRDAELTAAGYGVIRVTWRRLTQEPAAVAVQLRRALSR
jgi:very-short-patch-repair endonuclease